MDSHCNTSIWDSWFILSILVILGLLNLGIQIARICRGNSRGTFIFPTKGKGKNSRTSDQTRSDTGTILRDKLKCSLCNGPHSNLMHCKKLPQNLPYGTNQMPPPVSLWLICLGTINKNAKIVHFLIGIRCPTMCMYSVSFYKSVRIVLIGQ